jgi:hypothetical protein
MRQEGHSRRRNCARHRVWRSLGCNCYCRRRQTSALQPQPSVRRSVTVIVCVGYTALVVGQSASSVRHCHHHLALAEAGPAKLDGAHVCVGQGHEVLARVDRVGGTSSAGRCWQVCCQASAAQPGLCPCLYIRVEHCAGCWVHTCHADAHLSHDRLGGIGAAQSCCGSAAEAAWLGWVVQGAKNIQVQLRHVGRIEVEGTTGAAGVMQLGVVSAGDRSPVHVWSQCPGLC